MENLPNGDIVLDLEDEIVVLGEAYNTRPSRCSFQEAADIAVRQLDQLADGEWGIKRRHKKDHLEPLKGAKDKYERLLNDSDPHFKSSPLLVHIERLKKTADYLISAVATE